MTDCCADCPHLYFCCRGRWRRSLFPANIANKRREDRDIQFGFVCGGIEQNSAVQSIKQHLCLIYGGFHSSEFAISIILI